MKTVPYDVVVFDLDGTLVDSSPDLTSALNFVLRAFGRVELPSAVVRQMVGSGVRVLLDRGLCATGDSSPALVEKALPIFLENYAAHIADGSRIYEGARETLEQLREAGMRLAICTNKPEAHTHLLLAAMGWGSVFASVIGGDTLAVRKPNPAPLLEAVRRAGGGSAVLVGDSIMMWKRRERRGCPAWQ